ncbi:MAG TPA: ATP-grasp domain-containing protein [Chloroflexota bacterium]
MLLPEYHAKALFAEYGIAVPPGRLGGSAADAEEAARELRPPVMLKVQARTGGRGLAGGVLRCDDTEAAGGLYRQLAERWPEAAGPRGVLVEAAVASAAERYLAVAVDPRLGQPVLLAAARGGVAVEEQAPNAQPIDLCVGLQPHHAVQALKAAGWPRERLAAAAALATRLYRLFREQEAIVAEINPLAEAADGGLVALDARVALDDLALFRLPRWRDVVLADEAAFGQEALKLRAGFDYVDLNPDGTVGLMSTGAGGTMLLVDLLRARGVEPANFVDLRTGGMRGDSTRLEIVLGRLKARPRLRAVLVSVFGGITDIGEFAQTLLQAVERVGGVPWPLVVRLEGYGADAGLALLAAHDVVTERDLDAAVARTVALATS